MEKLIDYETAMSERKAQENRRNWIAHVNEIGNIRLFRKLRLYKPVRSRNVGRPKKRWIP